MYKRLTILIILALTIGACAQPATPTAPPAPTATPEKLEVNVVTEAPVQTAAVTVAPTTGPAPSAKQVDVVLINNFIGNSWRSVMERGLQLSLDYPPIKGRVKSLKS